MTQSEQAQRVDRSRVISTLVDLVEIVSVNPDMGGPEDGERNVAKYIADFFRAAGLPAELQEVLPGRPNVVGRLVRGHGLPWLVIEGHLDTVPAPPELVPQMTEGRLVGRGACDMKGGIAAALHAIEYLSGLDDLPLNIEFVGAIDEEFAYRGVLAYLEHGGRRDAAIVAEPSALYPVIAHSGVLRGRLVARGRSVHSSTPWLGENAIDVMLAALPPLSRWAHDRRPNSHPLIGQTCFSITEISGGRAINIIPDECSVNFDWRLHPSDDPDEVLSALQSHMDAASVPLELVDLLRDRGLSIDVDHPFARAVQASCNQISGRGDYRGMRAGTDASKLAYAGVPTIVLGPGSLDQAHTRDEWVDLDEVVEAAETYIELCTSVAGSLRSDVQNVPDSIAGSHGGR